MKKKLRFFVSLTMGLFLCSSLLNSCGDDEEDDKGSTEYFHYGGHSYKVVKKNKTWTEAAGQPKAIGYGMVPIKTVHQPHSGLEVIPDLPLPVLIITGVEPRPAN